MGPPDAEPGELEALRRELSELRAWRALIEPLLDQCPAAFSLKEAAEQGRYVYLNPHWENAFGRRSEGVIGRTDRELWPAEVAGQLESIDRSVLENGRPFEGVIAVPSREDGPRQWLSWRFPVGGGDGHRYLGGCSVDVTALHAPAPAAGTLEHRLLCESSSGLLGVIFGEGDRIVDANDPFLAMLRYTRDDLARGGMTLLSITSPDTSHVCEEIKRELDATGTFSLKETELVRKDGTIMAAGVGGAVLETTPPRTWVAYILDMADQRRIERRLRREEAWERLGLFAAGLAHDFNNLLVVIIGNTSMAAADHSVSGKVGAHLKEVLAAAEQAATLVRQILVYSGRTRLTPTHVNLGGAMREVLAAERVPVGVHVEVGIPDDLPPVSGDLAQLREAVRSLVVNAIEAVARGGGEVRIWVRACELEHPVVYPDTELAPGEYVCTSVEDTGEGMSERLQSRIFDPFFTTKFQGRGLGLAAAYGIARRHGGGIHVESAPGKGSRFEMLLPVASG
jgi:PAS domain S-box-containing protein